MTDLRKAAEDILETLDKPFSASKTIFQAKEALRQALSQPEQKPVAKYTGKYYRCPIVNLYQDIPLGTLLYTAPLKRDTECRRPEWVGLTAPEVHECYDLNPARFASNIESKLKEKNFVT